MGETYKDHEWKSAQFSVFWPLGSPIQQVHIQLLLLLDGVKSLKHGSMKSYVKRLVSSWS